MEMLGVFVKSSRGRADEALTAAGRSGKRLRLAASSTVAGWASRGAGLLLMLLGVGLTLPYLGPERFGLWMTFSSMVLLLTLLDFGIGHALLNRVAQACGRDDPQALRQTLAGGFGLLVALAGLGGVVLVALASSLPWGWLLGLDDPGLAAEARWAAQVLAGCLAVHLVATGLLKAIAGQQRGHVAHALNGGSAVLACLALWWCARQEASIPVLILATFGLPAVVNLLGALACLSRDDLPWTGVVHATAHEGPALIQLGLPFMALQGLAAFAWYSDSVILAHLHGPAEVAALAVGVRLFQFASQPFMVMNASLWAAYAEATARGEVEFVRQTLHRSMLWTLAGSAGLSLLLVAAAPPLVAAWTGGALAVPTSLLIALAACTVLEAAGHAFGMYLNGCGILREQLWVAGAFCALAVALKLAFGQAWGATGVVAATVVAYLAAEVGLYATLFRRQALSGLRLRAA